MSNCKARHLMARGKTAQGWVEGYFLPQHPTMPELGAVILAFPGAVAYPVDPDTVTSCSGLPDKNGKMIYDQDILANEKNETAGIVEYAEEDGSFALILKDGGMVLFSDADSMDYQIVGNGFDNADWLEVV